VGDADHTIGPETQVVDAGGKYLAPGFLDGHIHIESSMVSVAGFARAVLPHGTTGVFMDPHEISNVLGLEGIRLMHEEAGTLLCGYLPPFLLACPPLRNWKTPAQPSGPPRSGKPSGGRGLWGWER